MAKHFSFTAINVRPLSQNNRPSAKLDELRDDLKHAYNVKYSPGSLPCTPLLKEPLEAKVFYIHKIEDKMDADNISKPLWDALNKITYQDDFAIKYLETLKIDFGKTSDRLSLDVTNLDSQDFENLFDFIFDTRGIEDRFLYVAVSDYESKNVRFV